MIEDVTASGIPLPHPDNPARADIARVRNALTALDTRLEGALEVTEGLGEAIAAEVAARSSAIADEADARGDAIVAEATARHDADLALAQAIDDIPTFDPSGFYSKSETDALLLDLKPDLIEVEITAPVATVDFTIAAGHRSVLILWDDISHNHASDQQITLSYSTDAGATWSAAFFTQPGFAVANTVLMTGGIVFWLMPDETAMAYAVQPTGDVTAGIGGTTSGCVFDAPARMNRIRLKWTAGSIDAGVVRCRRSK